MLNRECEISGPRHGRCKPLIMQVKMHRNANKVMHLKGK